MDKYSFKGWKFWEKVEYGIGLGSMLFMAIATTIFGFVYKKTLPAEFPAIPLGFWIFFGGWVWDSMAHKSIYRNKIDKDELVVHNFMVWGSGAPLLICMILAYWNKWLMLPFIITFLFLKTMYSLIDECSMHWVRFKEGRSDLIEMHAHYFQFLGEILHDTAWLLWIYKYNYMF